MGSPQGQMKKKTLEMMQEKERRTRRGKVVGAMRQWVKVGKGEENRRTKCREMLLKVAGTLKVKVRRKRSKGKVVKVVRTVSVVVETRKCR